MTITCQSALAHNTAKTPEPLSNRIVKRSEILQFPKNIFKKSLSLSHLRRDYFSMPVMANIRKPETPATELRSIGREGVLHEGKQMDSGRSRARY